MPYNEKNFRFYFLYRGDKKHILIFFCTRFNANTISPLLATKVCKFSVTSIWGSLLHGMVAHQHRQNVLNFQHRRSQI